MYLERDPTRLFGKAVVDLIGLPRDSKATASKPAATSPAPLCRRSAHRLTFVAMRKMPRIQFRTKLRLINDPGVLRKFVYEERVKCQFRELCEHRVRTDDTRQVTESQFTEAKMFSRLRRSNSIFHFEKSPQSRALCLWFVCILNRILWPEIPVCRLKLPCVRKNFANLKISLSVLMPKFA